MSGLQSWSDRPVAAARAGIVVVLVMAPLAALVGHLVDGASGARAGLQGVCIPGVVLLLTSLAAELGARRSAQAFAGLLLVVLRDVDGADRNALGAAAVVGLLLALLVEARVITSTRLPYVEPVTPPNAP